MYQIQHDQKKKIHKLFTSSTELHQTHPTFFFTLRSLNKPHLYTASKKERATEKVRNVIYLRYAKGTE